MARLVVHTVDFNDRLTVEKLRRAITAILLRREQIYNLRFKPGYYFETPNRNPPSVPGWYVILGPQRRPIYVGQAGDLNARLNSNQGTLDNFAKTDRASDDERNFIKKFNEIGVFDELAAVIITESDLCEQLEVSGPLSDLDRNNVEKVLNLFRCVFRLVPSDVPEHVE